MTVPLKDQLACARAVLAQMRERKSRWTAAQEAIVRTLERQVLLKEVGDEWVGRETTEVEVKT